MADAPATADATSEVVDDVTVEDIGPARKRLTIIIPPETISEKLEDSVDTLAASTSLPGFRKGRAPRKLLERRFGAAVRTETKNQLLADAYAKAIEDKSIQAVGDPEPVTPTDELELQEGKPLTFIVEIEVVPEFDLPNLQGVEIKKPEFEVTDDDIETELTRQRAMMGKAVKIDGDFVANDLIAGRVTVEKDGEAEPLIKDEFTIVAVPGDDDGGRGPILGIMIQSLADLIKGTRIGDTLTVQTTGPEAHEREELRGAKLTIELKLTAGERIDPASIQQVVDAYGVGSEQNLTEQIRLAVQRRSEQDQASAMREQVYEYLLGAVELELPQKLSEAQVARNLERHRIELLEQGLMPPQVEARLAEIRADSETQTRDRLKLLFILRRLADHFQIEVSEQEINGRIASIAAHRGLRPDQVRAELTQMGRLSEVGHLIRQQKAADRVIAEAKVTGVPAADWRADRADAASKAKGKSKTAGKPKKTTSAKDASPKTTTKKKTGGSRKN